MWPLSGKKDPKPTLPQPVASAPGGPSIGVNVPPHSVQAQLRIVSRMLRLIDAQAKASRKGDKARMDALDDELTEKRTRLLGIGVRAPYKREELSKLLDELIARQRAGEA